MTPTVALALWAAVGFFIAAAAAVAGAAITLPPTGWRNLHWTQQARIAHAARVGPAINAYVIALILVPAGAMFLNVTTGFVPTVKDLAIGHCLAMAGCIGVAMLSAFNVTPRRRPLWWLAGCATTVLVAFPNTLVYLTMGIMLLIVGVTPGGIAGVLLVGAIAMAFATWGGGVLVAQLLGLARPALPRLQGIADWAAERAGVSASKVFEIRSPKVMVDAFVFSRFLVVTDAGAELLSDEELLALSVREVTFFQQPWLTGSLRALDGVLIYFMLATTAIGAASSQQAMLLGVGAGLLGAFAARSFTRKAHVRSDELAAKANLDPQGALRALERQYELNRTPMVASAGSSLPSLYDRLIAAGIQPAYPRPLPVSKGKIVLSVLTAAAAGIVFSIAIIVVTSVVMSL